MYTNLDKFVLCRFCLLATLVSRACSYVALLASHMPCFHDRGLICSYLYVTIKHKSRDELCAIG